MLHLAPLITDLALILGSAAVITLVFKKLKQPVVLGYIIAGLLVGPHFNLFPTIAEIKSIETWAEIGVIVLLFSLGLEFSFKKLVKVGGVAVVTAVIEVSMTMLLGYSVGKMLGWESMDCLFLGGILAIASTTIIIRAFDELGVKSQKFTGIVMGILVVEDLVAVVLMVLLSTVSVSRTLQGTELIGSILKLAFFLVLWFVAGIFFLPTLLKSLRKLMSEETLLIVSLALCFMMVVLATQAGFSPALGAFIMGSILAETTQAEKIEHLVKSVKDLFGAIFFVSVGMLINPQMLVEHWGPVLVASLVLLLGKPLFVITGALITGQPMKIAVQSGMSLSQIGEFSFIIASLGLTLKVTSDFLYPIAVAVSVITTFTTPYMIRFSEPVYRRLESWLPLRWQNTLTAYSAGAQNITQVSDWRVLLRSYFVNILIFSVVIMTVIVLSTRYLTHTLAAHQWSNILTAALTLVILAPFIWALAFRRTQKEAYANIWVKPAQRGPLVMLQLSRILLAVFYIGFLFDRLFSQVVALTGALIAVAILAIFSKKIQSFYGKIELRFLSNLNERELVSAPVSHPLAPWDTHLATFELKPLSPYVGKTLMESKIREDYGVNIALIERGECTIHVPGRNERLYPHDVLSVIGTDEQLTKFKDALDTSVLGANALPQKQDVSLQQFTIHTHSPLLGKTILNSAIREQTKGLVVGIERDGQRLLNPESDTVFELNDKVWIVGNAKRLQVITGSASSSRFLNPKA